MKITLGTLKEKGDDLIAFLEPRVGVKPSISGDSMEIDDDGVRKGVKPRDVKTYIKRFLFMNGVRKKYRVFVQGKELTIQEIELEEEEEKEEKGGKEEAKEKEPPKEEATPEPKKEEPKEEKPKKAAAKKPRGKKKTESEG
jgi:hypothetical protein